MTFYRRRNSVSRPISEQVLLRVHSYLEAIGLEMTPEQSLQALKLVEDALIQQSLEPMVFDMYELPRRFPLPPIPLTPAFPPMDRGRIGYSDVLIMSQYYNCSKDYCVQSYNL